MTRMPFFALLIAASVPLALPADAQIQISLDNLASKAKDSVDISLPTPMYQITMCSTR